MLGVVKGALFACGSGECRGQQRASPVASDDPDQTDRLPILSWPGLTGPSSNHRHRRMKKDHSYWVYILASDIGGTLYIGVTNDLVRRTYEHCTDGVGGFTQRYSVHRLVYYEQFDQIEFAIQREKRLKKWNRSWKIELIEKTNPHWIDLYPAIAHP
jgi:putative endonuclease